MRASVSPRHPVPRECCPRLFQLESFINPRHVPFLVCHRVYRIRAPIRQHHPHRPSDAAQNPSISIDSGCPPIESMRFSAAVVCRSSHSPRDAEACRMANTTGRDDASRLVRLVLDEGDDHAVEVEEEQDEVEAELRERFLLRSVSSLWPPISEPARWCSPSCGRSACGKSRSRPAGGCCQ